MVRDDSRARAKATVRATVSESDLEPDDTFWGKSKRQMADELETDKGANWRSERVKTKRRLAERRGQLWDVWCSIKSSGRINQARTVCRPGSSLCSWPRRSLGRARSPAASSLAPAGLESARRGAPQVAGPLWRQTIAPTWARHLQRPSTARGSSCPIMPNAVLLSDRPTGRGSSCVALADI